MFNIGDEVILKGTRHGDIIGEIDDKFEGYTGVDGGVATFATKYSVQHAELPTRFVGVSAEDLELVTNYEDKLKL